MAESAPSTTEAGRGGRGRGRGGRGRVGRGRGRGRGGRGRGPRRSNVCFHYSTKGECQVGDKCKFLHEKPAGTAVDGKTALDDPTITTAVSGFEEKKVDEQHQHQHQHQASKPVMPTAAPVPMPVPTTQYPTLSQSTQPARHAFDMIPACGFTPVPVVEEVVPLRKPAASAIHPSKNNNMVPSKTQQSQTSTSTSSSSTKPQHITNKKFADLPHVSSESRRALSQVFKYEYMTSVQAETLPLILHDDKKDCLAKAKTGTGKTLAFMIPTLEKVKVTMTKERRDDIHCLVISPTRELAQQISNEATKLLTFHKPFMRKVVCCVGGTNKSKDVRALKGTTPIVVGTPGRLLDHLQNCNGEGLAARMTNLDTLVFDEADQLLDMGFRPDIERILKLLQPSAATRQTLLFSATIPNQVNEIARIAMKGGYNFVDTVGKDEEQTHLHVQQQLMVTSQERLIRNLFAILDRETTCGKPYKIIVFFTTARLVGFMSEAFNSVAGETGYRVLEIHSRKSQPARERASEEFRTKKNAILFTSDVSARGMDYPDVTFVLQVGLTERAQYIHRLGRTARAGKDGKGGLLLADYERDYMVKRELADMPLELVEIPADSPRADNAAAKAFRNVAEDKKGLKGSAEAAYRAWLGYYNSNLKKVRWDKKQLVRQANLWATEVGLTEQPSVQKRTVGKMGLKGVVGLKLE